GGNQRTGAVLYRVKERYCGRPGECLGRSLRDEHKGDYQGDGDEDHNAAHQEHPEVSYGRCRSPRERVDERDKDRQPDCRRNEVFDDEAGHLREVADRYFRHVCLPVGVGRKTDRGVEREIPGNCPESCRVEGQELLDFLEDENSADTGNGKDHDSDGKLLPVHILSGCNPAYGKDFYLEPSDDGGEEVRLTGEDLCHPCTERY